jgi:hypothetical protein
VASLKCRLHGQQPKGKKFCPICMEELVPDVPEQEHAEPAICPEPNCDNVLGPDGCPMHSLAPAEIAAPRATTRDPGPAGSAAVVEFPWGAVEVGTPALTVGRDPEYPLAPHLARYDNVSRRHATLWQEGADLYVQDQGSTNGTFVNDRKIDGHERVLLRQGDSVRFGATLRGVVRRSRQ